MKLYVVSIETKDFFRVDVFKDEKDAQRHFVDTAEMHCEALGSEEEFGVEIVRNFKDLAEMEENDWVLKERWKLKKVYGVNLRLTKTSLHP